MPKTTGTQPRFASMALASLALATACNALDEPQESPIGKTVKIVPTDTRPVSEPDRSPPPITGGTMLTLDDGVAVADPARNRISLVTPAGEQVRHIALSPGAEPFRMTQGADGDLYVVLRGSGEVARIDVASASIETRAKVCATPRGIDYDALSDELVVACAEGRLVNLTPGDLAFKSDLRLEPDIRDVVVQGARRYVSRFRSAEVLFVEQGQVVRRVKPEGFLQFSPGSVSGEQRTLSATVAWRMVSDPRGGVMISHQRAVVDNVGIDPHADGGENTATSFSSQSSPYGGSGGGFNCDGIVQSSVSAIGTDGAVTSSRPLLGVVLPVDLAISPDGGTIAVANAGLRDPEAPLVQFEFVPDPDDEGDFFSFATPMEGPAAGFSSSGGTFLFDRGSLIQANQEALNSGCEFGVESIGTGPGGTGPGTSVAFTDDNKILTQEPGPAVLRRVDRLTFETVQVALGGEEIVQTGHEIFHRDSGGGLACASCHPEGGDDGHVWMFDGLGARRTQNLAVPLKDTAPFHWDGSLPNLDTLMGEVFVERMGGALQSEARVASLENWLFSRVSPVMPAADEAAAARGKQLFNSSDVGCGKCHTGSAFTDNKSYNVGTTLQAVVLQVPPLNGLLLRPPFMHNGCAKTLHQRFDATCGGGDAHGRTSQLSPQEIDDLVAYMSAL